MYDIIIIGAGPAGMTAAIYATQARKKVLLLEKEAFGGQILKANKVKNYPGFKEISGYDIANNIYEQVKDLGIEIKLDEVVGIESEENKKIVKTKKDTYECKAIIVATGATNRKLGIENEDKLIGKGVSYCSTCDGMFFKDKIVAITGGGVNAVDDALYLSDIVKKLYVVYRQKDFKFDSINLQKLKEKENVEFILNSNIIKLNGDNKLEEIVIENNDTKENTNVNVDGLFIAIGHIPVSGMCKNIVSTDDKGYVIAKEDCKTNIDGIFAAGDIRIKNIRQLTTACADGTTAAINACKYINEK